MVIDIAFKSIDMDGGFDCDDVYDLVTFLCGEYDICDGY